MSYGTQATIENILGRCLTDKEQASLAQLFSIADGWISQQIGGSYGDAAVATKYYDGGSVMLDIDPCVDITKVAIVDDYEEDSYVYESGVDFEARPRNESLKKWLQSRTGAFPCGVANIAVTANFSLGTTAPEDIQYLSSYLVAQVMLNQENGTLKSESIEGYSRTFKEYKTSDDTVLFILNKYTEDESPI